MTTEEKLGAQVRKLRKAQGMTQMRLAAVLGVELAVVSRWENGKGLPSLKNALALAKVLDCQWDELIDGV